MQAFLDDDFLLATATAKTLYHQFAKDMPVLDYHSHVNPRDIAEDRQYENIAQMWLSGDHYKWRLMRWCGVDEKFITGGAPDEEKFFAFAEVLPKAAGNPLYHWAHLELRRYFDCGTLLGPQTARQVWNHCNEKLRKDLSVRKIIAKSNVKALCTTDDPADDLRWHARLAGGGGQAADTKGAGCGLAAEIKVGAAPHAGAAFAAQVLPTFRPDAALNVHKPGFAAYLEKLSAAWGRPIASYAALCEALRGRLDFFVLNGCVIADHGLDEIPWNPAAPAPDTVFARAAAGEVVPRAEAESYQAALLLHLAGEYEKRGLAMQLHYGVQRNVNPPAFAAFGADTGYDCIATPCSAQKLGRLLGAMAQENGLPKTILYSLNPADNEMLASLAGSFQRAGTPGWVQHGSAWWFNDSIRGMQAQLHSLADIGVLGSFIGMLTDSRSFTSYARHEYFRRVLCALLGSWVENGEYPHDLEMLGELVRGICYENAAHYLGLGL